jgi:biopolymer transport protein TolR
MGATIKAAGGGKNRSKRRRAAAPMSEINVTPMVDVMLVLLIIFMVTAPLMAVGVPVDLPKTEANQMKTDKDSLTVSVTGDGKIFLQDTPVSLDEIVPKLKAISHNNAEAHIVVRGDQSTNFGLMSQVMGAINGAGFTHMGLMQLPQEGSAQDGSAKPQ